MLDTKRWVIEDTRLGGRYVGIHHKTVDTSVSTEALSGQFRISPGGPCTPYSCPPRPERRGETQPLSLGDTPVESGPVTAPWSRAAPPWLA